jgi:methionyl-tRNA formyltransferase
VLDDLLIIACGKGALRLMELQRAGKRPMAAQEYSRGTKLRPGSVLV